MCSLNLKKLNINRENVFKCIECDYECKTKNNLKRHLWYVHDIGKGEIFKCTKEDCDYKSKIKKNLKRHLWCVHNIGEGGIFKCTEEGCDYKCKSNSGLKQHLWCVHNIGEGGILKCTEEGCDYKSKTNSHFKRHLWCVHNIGEGKMFKCTEEGCDYKSKTNDHLKEHLWCVHNIGEGKIFKCTEEDCNFEFKRNGDLKQHLWSVHNKGEGKIFKCTEEHCNFECKSKNNLTQHIWCIHNKGEGKIFKCTEEDCDFECKSKNNLTQHLSAVHDIGDYECQICFKMVFKLLPDFHNPNVNNREEIIKNACRNCFRKITDYTSRVEKQMVEYIEQDILLSPYIYSKDKILKGSSCDTKRRPDLMISSTEELVIVIECDEKQHQGYNSSCEMGRMDEILDELKGCRTIFIRWNPDYCKNNGARLSKTRDNRLIQLKELILNLIKKNWTDDYTMVYYMYYNKDNEVITNRHKFKLLY